MRGAPRGVYECVSIREMAKEAIEDLVKTWDETLHLSSTTPRMARHGSIADTKCVGKKCLDDG